MKTINGIAVNDGMYDVAAQARRVGAKQFISKLEPSSASDCQNCGGAKTIDYSIAIGGPSESPMPCDGSRGESIHWHDGSWYKVRSHGYTCPVRKGSGLNHR